MSKRGLGFLGTTLEAYEEHRKQVIESLRPVNVMKKQHVVKATSRNFLNSKCR